MRNNSWRNDLGNIEKTIVTLQDENNALRDDNERLALENSAQRTEIAELKIQLELHQFRYRGVAVPRQVAPQPTQARLATTTSIPGNQPANLVADPFDSAGSTPTMTLYVQVPGPSIIAGVAYPSCTVVTPVIVDGTGNWSLARYMRADEGSLLTIDPALAVREGGLNQRMPAAQRSIPCERQPAQKNKGPAPLVFTLYQPNNGDAEQVAPASKKPRAASKKSSAVSKPSAKTSPAANLSSLFQNQVIKPAAKSKPLVKQEFEIKQEPNYGAGLK